MEFYKTLFAAILMATTLSSVAWTAPLRSQPSDAELVIRNALVPTRANATKQMLKVYQFISSNWDLKETPLVLGVADTPICSSNLQKQDNLSIAVIQLHNFINPLYLAYSYEEAQGSQNKVLASLLWDTSLYLNATVGRVLHEIIKNGFQVPTGQNVSEMLLNRYTRRYLQHLVNNNVLSLTITDDVVKIYRNYVILYTLKDVIDDVLTCL